MEIVTAEREYTLEATRAKLWSLLGRAIFDSLSGLEKMKVLDENNFRAELKVKVFGLPMRMYLRGEVIDITPPRSMSVKLLTRTKPSVINMVQKISFSLEDVGEGKTKVTAVAKADLNALFRIAVAGQIKNQAVQIFDHIEAKFRDWL